MDLIITVVGKRQKGVVAGVGKKVAGWDLISFDISQPVMDGRMMAVVSSDEEKKDFLCVPKLEEFPVSLFLKIQHQRSIT